MLSTATSHARSFGDDSGEDNGLTGYAIDRGALRLEFQATPEAVRRARHAVALWWQDRGLPTARLNDVRLATSEVVGNSVSHAYRPAPQPGSVVELEVWSECDVVHVLVRDFGVGVRPNANSRGAGFGLPLIASLADRVSVRSRPTGGLTEVEIVFELSH